MERLDDFLEPLRDWITVHTDPHRLLVLGAPWRVEVEPRDRDGNGDPHRLGLERFDVGGDAGEPPVVVALRLSIASRSRRRMKATMRRRARGGTQAQ